ncbi:hypothetical protein HYS54_04150 [Candidatus Micrarchaeota archaeon]|nr:hypothetical protein [Candidatus Micrarchaeota archaeon]
MKDIFVLGKPILWAVTLLLVIAYVFPKLFLFLVAVTGYALCARQARRARAAAREDLEWSNLLRRERQPWEGDW